jgi:murein endopeptidase
VTVAELKRWNKGYGKNGQLYAGRSLKVHARLVPPPREKILVNVNKGDTWGKIAARHGVREKDLRAWNKSVPTKFKAGTALVVYTNPTVEDQAAVATPGALPQFNVPRGGYAIGAPNSGRLAGGVQLPDSEMYKLRRPENAYGTSHAVKVVLESIARYTRDAKPDMPLEIGDMSKLGGGRLRPHSSHRTGRDIDIRLPKVGDEIDWRAAWILVRSFIASGEVTYIFLDYSQQRQLHRAAKAAGATDKELEAAIQYPRGSRTNNGIVRHAKGHTVHIHVRVKCAEANDRCASD